MPFDSMREAPAAAAARGPGREIKFSTCSSWLLALALAVMAMALSLLLLLSLPSSPRAVADTATVSVNLSSGSPRHPLNPLHFGCHMDLGFAHPARSIYSQLLFGGSFEFGLAGYGDISGPEHDGHSDIRAAALHGIVWNALLPGNTTTAPALALVAAAPSLPAPPRRNPARKRQGIRTALRTPAQASVRAPPSRPARRARRDRGRHRRLPVAAAPSASTTAPPTTASPA